MTRGRTEGSGRGEDEAAQTVKEIIRRSGHEIRNALNAVAVNVEVVRSRSGADDKREIASFAQRAVSQTSEASALTDGLLAFVAACAGKDAVRPAGEPSGAVDGSRIELKTYNDSADRLVSQIEHLASRIGLVVEQRGGSVILTVSTQGNSDSKV